MTDQSDDKKPIVHELRAAPFHLDRPWLNIDGSDTPPEWREYEGPIVVLTTDHTEKDAKRWRYGVIEHTGGGRITHWRVP
jgi:hypothetical protein